MDWQSSMMTIQQANSYLLNSGTLSDVTFLVGENQDEVKAHKFILMTRSHIFEVMFKRWETATNCRIEIPEVRSTSFRAFLSFLYTNICPELQGTEVVEVLYLAHKYSAKSMAAKASDILRRDVSAATVIQIHQFAKTLEQHDLEKETLKFMCRNGRAVFERPEFLNIDAGTLETLLKSDKLCIEEVILFKAVAGWAEHQCEIKEIENNGQNKRMILENILPLIRFPRMNSQNFSEEVISKHPGLLTESEAVELFLYFNTGPVVKPTLAPLQFNTNGRDPGNTYRVSPYNKEQTCTYFVPIGDKSATTIVSREESMLFSSNTDVYISGFELYGPIYRGGSDTGNASRVPMNVKIFLMDFHGAQVGFGTDQIFVKPLEAFVVEFETSIKITKKTAHYAVVHLQGPQTCTGLFLSSKREVVTYHGRVRFKLWSKRLDWKTLIPTEPLTGATPETCSGKIKAILFKV